MTTPDPQAYVRDQLAQGLEVQGEVAAPIYGDQANAAHPPQQMDLAAARAVAVDAQALLARIQDLEAKQQAAELAANPPPGPPDNSIRADSNAPSWAHDAFAKAEGRLSAIEAHLGL